jgi:CBS domain-containing protein
MRVRDLMQTELATLEVSDNLDLADDIMRLGRIRHMPVLDRDRLVGILSQRDLFRAGASSVLQLRREAERDWLGEVLVRSVMATRVFTISPEASIRDAVQVMIDKKVGCVPVVENDRLVGLLAESDCLRYLARVLDISDVKRALPELASS